MRWTLMILAAVSLFGSAAALSQGQGQVRTPEVPPTDTIAEDIPGVIKGGTKIEVVIANVPGHGDPGVTLQGTEGPIALPDGTMVFCETILARVAKVERDGKESVFVDAALAGGPNGLTWGPGAGSLVQRRLRVRWASEWFIQRAVKRCLPIISTGSLSFARTI